VATQERGNWNSHLGFVLAAAGSAIGLGNLWKFPYITWHNEGGAFVLVYLISVIAVGLPIMMAEILIGRKTQKSPVGAMAAAVGKRWAWVGGLGVFTGFVILGYYSVIAGWTLRYFVKCVGWSTSGFEVADSTGEAFGEFVGNGLLQVGLAGLFMLFTIAVVMRGVSAGIEKVARILMPILFAILLLLLFSALRMKGSGEALAFIFKPDFANLPPRGVLEALGHAFFTLSLGMGAMITYGSYLSKRECLVKASAIVVALDTLIAMIASTIMFSVIFSVPGMPEKVGGSTVGMLFITLPELFYNEMPMGSVLAPLFYMLVGFAALTSTISLLEVITSYFIDQRGMSRSKSTILCGAGTFVLSALCALSFGASKLLSDFSWVYAGTDGAKTGLFDHLDYVAANWLLPVGGFMITIAVGWFMTQESTESELVADDNPRWFRYGVWRIAIRFVAPVAVASIIVAVLLGKDFS
jgi:NSS family neurotransmitter:Na+ symporter